MAKVIYPATVTGIVGRITTGVYYRSGSQKFGYIRSWAMPTIVQNMTRHGLYMKNIRNMLIEQMESDARAQFSLYAEEYKKLPSYGEAYSVRANSAFAIFYKSIYLWGVAQSPTVDLSSVTMEDTHTIGGYGANLKEVIEAGWLPMTPDYLTYTEPFLAGP